ncbi:hypothetical protein RFI_34547 [Reticulomyxa filosa]|uniref:Uncharacterized protein n=1 Tax=Reticulomyxa filosa TaxID=46433 RepID=X6LNE6_RETFI|nr:hypothetical protein RFI_34547 [Reticulomyxa filosa]|eukprot:ETO02866.1 hypothetical protein RFI_34547 [Reticulomyxa filosa]
MHVQSSIQFFKFPTPEEEEEVFFKSLLEDCISSLILLLKVKTTATKRASVRMSQSKHTLKCVQEYLGMAREATIGKENLDYLNHHDTFYICDMMDNLQYWMIAVEKESFVVCCENGGLPSHNLSPLQFFKITHHIVPICLDTAKSMMVHTTDNNIVGSSGSSNKDSHHKNVNGVPSWTRFFDQRLLMYSGKLLMNKTPSQQQIVKIFRGLKIQRENDKINKHSKFEYLEKFRDSLAFFKEKGKYYFGDMTIIMHILLFIYSYMTLEIFFANKKSKESAIHTQKRQFFPIKQI